MSLKNFNYFYSNYKKNFINNFISSKSETFLKAIKILRNIKNKKILIFGNGGSSSIASHASLDLTNVCNIKSLHFNDPSLITCYANDYGYENLITQSLKKFLEKEDVVILISSSGESKNIVNAAEFIKNNTLITFTGFNKNNSLKKLGDINFWVNSKNYNIIENIHQTWLLMIVDYIRQFK